MVGHMELHKDLAATMDMETIMVADSMQHMTQATALMTTMQIVMGMGSTVKLLVRIGKVLSRLQDIRKDLLCIKDIRKQGPMGNGNGMVHGRIVAQERSVTLLGRQREVLDNCIEVRNQLTTLFEYY
jgi:hypothetical protein